MDKITKTSTKDVIFSAYQDALKKVKELESVKLDPAKEVAAKKATITLEKAETVASADIGTQVDRVKTSVEKALTDLLVNIEEQKASYNSIREAIAIKENELKELFGIEFVAGSMAALVNSKTQIAEQFDADMTAKKTALEAELVDLRLQLKAEKDAHLNSIKELDAQIKADRVKDAAEYKYTFDRQKMLDKDAWDDEMRTAKRLFDAELANKDAVLTEKIKAVDAMEATLCEKEKNLATWEAKVAEIPTVVEAAVNKAVADKEKSLQTAFAIEKNYLKKDAESQAALAQAKIDNLTDALATEKANAGALATKLDEAYAKIEAMAKASVEGASKANYAASLEQMLKDSKPSTYSK